MPGVISIEGDRRAEISAALRAAGFKRRFFSRRSFDGVAPPYDGASVRIETEYFVKRKITVVRFEYSDIETGTNLVRLLEPYRN